MQSIKNKSTGRTSSNRSFAPGHDRRRWRRLDPKLHDKIAVLVPLAAVVLFFASISATLAYLRVEESNREQEAVQRDVQYTQQHLRLRFLGQQEQFLRTSRAIEDRRLTVAQFKLRAQSMLREFPELHSISWLDSEQKKIVSIGGSMQLNKASRSVHKPVTTMPDFARMRQLSQPTYMQRSRTKGEQPVLQLLTPINIRGNFAGVLIVEYSLDKVLQYCVPPEITARYAVSLLNSEGQMVTGTAIPSKENKAGLRLWATRISEYTSAMAPAEHLLWLRAQAYRDSPGMVNSGLFWLTAALSMLTAWMLIANWRHSRQRLLAQQALISETSFRRAMENSMSTGMQAMNLEGRITYVNAAFCQMTGWAESDLVGHTAPFIYWPATDRAQLMQRLQEKLSGQITATGTQIRIQRRDNTQFEARLYVSPLVDSAGTQTGWMTSMTDITEPNRVREQLSASHQRFTTVLEALDASISVVRFADNELLFANKMYRQWFGSLGTGHQRLIHAGKAPKIFTQEPNEDIGPLSEIQVNTLPDVEVESTNVYIEELGKWLEVRTRAISWVDGGLAQMAIATDITVRRLSEEQLATQFEKAQTASHLITMGEMASSVAHELNQPLTAINNYCNGMVSRIKTQQISEEDLLTVLEKTARQAQRAGQIIQRIRSFAKRSEPNRTRTEIGMMVAEAMEFAELELRRFNVRISPEITANLPTLMVDPILIQQVLVNLLRNAAESIDIALRPPVQRIVELRVGPRLMDNKTGIEFSVQDTGNGLTPEVMSRLYETFYSTKVDGMGIGLSLCRSIVESHLGRMHAENIYNETSVSGCRFSFWLPASQGDESPPLSPTNNKSTT